MKFKQVQKEVSKCMSEIVVWYIKMICDYKGRYYWWFRALILVIMTGKNEWPQNLQCIYLRASAELHPGPLLFIRYLEDFVWKHQEFNDDKFLALFMRFQVKSFLQSLCNKILHWFPVIPCAFSNKIGICLWKFSIVHAHYVSLGHQRRP